MNQAVLKELFPDLPLGTARNTAVSAIIIITVVINCS